MPPRRILSLWFPHLSADRALRGRPLDGPFVLSRRSGNTERVDGLNPAAARAGLARGMAMSEARVFCPGLVSQPADPDADARFLAGLRRWALRFCPWVGTEGADGLVLDLTGSAHLAGGEGALLADLRQRLDAAGVQVRLGLADTRGAAWALARGGEGVAASGAAATRTAIAPLPVALLRIDPDAAVALQRLGLIRIGALLDVPRQPLVRRFGPGLMLRLDQATGAVPEPVDPAPPPPPLAVRLTLPEPIGLTADVTAGTARLLKALCARLRGQRLGARVLALTLRRVDAASRTVELRLARAMDDPGAILPLFARGIEGVDSGFGIDQLRLAATRAEPLAPEQGVLGAARPDSALDHLITRIGTRIGLDNVLRPLPAQSHIPERGFLIAPAAFSTPDGAFAAPRPRPLLLFPPEPMRPVDDAATAPEGGVPGEAEGRAHSSAPCTDAGLAADASRAPPRGGGPGAAGRRLGEGSSAGGSLRPADAPAPAPCPPAPCPPAPCPPAPCPPAGRPPPPRRPVPGGRQAPSAARVGPGRRDAGPPPAAAQPAAPAMPTGPFATQTAAAPAPTRHPVPPRRFRWRRMTLTVLQSFGPERLAPEWWFDDPAWRSGVRDYWRVDTAEGRRLWVFHTPDAPGWQVQGEFA